MNRSGTCLCGGLQFELEGEPVFPHSCACSMCRRWAGAPWMDWVEFPRAGLRWLGEDNLKLYRSSPKTQRGFCQLCGSSLVALDDDSEWVSVARESLRDPDPSLRPRSTSFPEGLPAWIQIPSLPPPKDSD